jgi:hypothetical protein
MTSINDLQRIYKNYIDTREKNEKRRDYLCIATVAGAVGVWSDRQFAPEYLPSVAVVCGHSLLNHTAVYNRGTKLLSKWVFKERDLRTIGYKFLTETGIYMAADYAVIKWLAPQFMSPIHKYIIRMRYTGLVVGGISVLAIGSLYIPWVQNRIVKFLADSIRPAPLLVGIVTAYSGMPANQVAIPEPPPAPKIPYSVVAELVSTTGTDDLTCGICMQDSQTITNTDKTHLIKTRECAHVFCIPCIEAWLNIGYGESVRQAKYCPMCRTPIISLADLPNRTFRPPNDGLEEHIRYIIANFRI